MLRNHITWLLIATSEQENSNLHSNIKMAQLRVFSLLGDSNIRNNVNQTACRANASIKASQVLFCGHFETFGDSLKKVRPESNVCIVACITNFLTSIDGPSVSQRVQPVLQDVREVLLEVCGANAACEFFLSPPMYRSAPVWYREGLPEVLTIFSQTLGRDLPGNFHLLPSFATPEFAPDGVHLTSYSGLEYLLHLFESSSEILERSPELGDVSVRTCETTRALEDRMMALEQDHRRLNRIVDNKIAIDSEQSDFRQNERFEDSFVIAGLPRISDDLVGKDWQVQAIKNVQAAIKALMGRQMSIVFVQNSTKRYQGAEVTYTVRMAEISDSRAIRDKFGSYFLGGKGDRRPEGIKGFSIKNRVTPETLTRISIMKLIAKRYKDSNPGSRVQVIGYAPRPLFKYTPASNASDRRPRVYNYIETVTKMPTNFSESEVEPILRRINPEMSGRIRSTFIILSDDHFKKLLKERKAHAPAAEAAGGPEADADAEANTGNSATTDAGDQNQGPNPAAPAAAPNPAPGTSSSTRKRGATSPAGEASSAKK